MKKLIVLLITWSLFHQPVARSQPSLLSQQLLIEILVDLELTREIINQDIPDNPQLAQTVLQEQVELVFNAHAIDRVIFQESYLHYLADPKQFQKLQEHLIAQLEKILQEAEEKQ